MKKVWQLCAAALCVGALFTGGALAAETPEDVLPAEGALPEAWGDLSEPGIALFSLDGGVWDEDALCYGVVLTGEEKEAYERLEAAYADYDALERKTDGDGAVYAVASGLFSTEYTDAYQTWFNEKGAVIQTAATAYRCDHTESFFLGSRYGASAATWYENRTLMMRVDCEFTLTAECQDAAAYESFQSEIDAVVDTLMEETAGLSPVARLAYWDNWLAANNEYNQDAADQGLDYENKTPWNVISGLLPDYEPVCEGYSRSLQLLCHQAGIPCVVLNSYSHMWNAVQVGGVWYVVDSTWNDPVWNNAGETLKYSTRNYFLVSAPTDSSHAVNMSFPTPPVSESGFFKDWTLTDGGLTGSVSASQSTTRWWVALYDELGRMIACAEGDWIDWPGSSFGKVCIAPAFDSRDLAQAEYAVRFGVDTGGSWIPVDAALTIEKAA